MTARSLLLFVSLWCVLHAPMLHGDEPSKAVLAQRAKAATALVDVAARQATGSGFCIHPSGLFVTNEHVVAGAPEVTVVLNAGLPNQRVLPAKVIRTEPALDLALLRVEGVKDLPTLPLGSVEKLTELADVIACGFPFGQGLTFERKDYPASSINRGTISSLRRQDGVLRLLQLDAELNPGNSGGPVLDAAGTVVGVVASGVKGSRVNFAVPVSLLTPFVRQTEVQFRAPSIDHAQAMKPAWFEAMAVTGWPDVRPLELELVLSSRMGEQRRYAMKAQGETYRVQAPPLPRAVASGLRVAVRFADGAVEGTVDDRTLTVGKIDLKLSELRALHLEPKARAELLDGRVIEGNVTGLTAVPIRLGPQTLTVNLLMAREVGVHRAGTDLVVWCTVIAKRGDAEVGRASRAILLDERSKVLLTELEPASKKMGPWDLGKGVLGNAEQTPITVQGVRQPKSLAMHPDASVQYRLGRTATLFQARVSYDDTNDGKRTGETVFEVVGDGKVLWRSRAIVGKSQTDDCVADVRGIDVLELRVTTKGSAFGAHAVWLDPFLIASTSEALRKLGTR